jgi:excisionase family DNA binding protein
MRGDVLRARANAIAELLRTREAAAALGVSTGTVRNMCRRGTLPHVWVTERSLRVPSSAVQRILRGIKGARG